MLQYICDGFPLVNGTAYISVSYEGEYRKTTDHTLNLITSIGGGIVSLVSKLATICRPEGSLILIPLGFLGDISTVYGVLSSMDAAMEMMPDGKYDYYSVTITWTDVRTVDQDFRVFEYAVCSANMVYVWHDENEGPAFWYCVDTSANSTIERFVN